MKTGFKAYWKKYGVLLLVSCIMLIISVVVLFYADRVKNAANIGDEAFKAFLIIFIFVLAVSAFIIFNVFFHKLDTDKLINGKISYE